MEVGEAALHEASAEIQSPRRKVIRAESEETPDNVRATLAISQEEAEEMGFVPSALGAPRGAFTGVTIDAVKRPSDTGRQPQWLLKKVVKPAQSICVSSTKLKSWCSRANSH